MDPHQSAALAAFLAAHADALRALLPPHLWPVAPFKVEQFGALTKYTLGEVEPGVWAMLHRLTAPDAGPPHCHPCDFDSLVLCGGYVERIWEPTSDGWASRLVRRSRGASFLIPAERVHEIIDLPCGESWTYVQAGPVVRQWQHYPDLAA